MAGAQCSFRSVREPSQVPVGNPHPSKEPQSRQDNSLSPSKRGENEDQDTLTERPRLQDGAGQQRAGEGRAGSSGQEGGPRRPRPCLATGSDSF